MTEEDKITKRRLREDSLYEVIDEGLELRRSPLKKQKAYKAKVRVSKAEYTFLQNHYIIFKWAIANNDIILPELDVLLHMYPVTVFTTKQFKIAQKEIGAANAGRFFAMKKKGYFIEWSKKKSNIYYTLTNKASTLVSRLHRMFMMEEEIPTSARRNVIAQSKKPKDKVLMDLFKRFNKKI